MDIAGTIERLSPGYWLGEAGAAAAGMNMSQPVSNLIEYWRRNGITPDRLEEIRHQNLSPSSALPGRADILTGMAQAMLERGVQGAGGLVPNPLSLFVDIGRGGGQVHDLHKYMIKRLAEADAPGFEHKTVRIDGKPVQIWVDASSAAEHGSGQPIVYTDLEAPDPRDRNPADPARASSLNAQIDSMKSQAIEDVHRYSSQHSLENYGLNLERAISDGTFGQRPRIIHPEHPAPPPADFEPRTPSPTPPGPAPLY